MAFTRPVLGADISAADFGQPVYDQLSGIGQDKTAFTPAMYATGGAPTLGNATIQCYYHRIGKWWHMLYMIAYGSVIDGGIGPVSFGLPAGCVSTVAAIGTTKTYIAGIANYAGVAYCNPGENRIHPLFPLTYQNNQMMDYRATADGNPGTGIPQVPGQYTIAAGNNFQADIWVCG